MSTTERGESFKYLMEVNFGFVGRGWPRLDRNAFSKRSRKWKKSRRIYSIKTS